MKATAKELAARARAGIATVRESFARSTFAATPASSGSARSYVAGVSNSLLSGSAEQSEASVGFGLGASVPGGGLVPPTPSIDRASPTLGSMGVGDSMSCGITVSFETDRLRDVSVVRLMRTELGPADAAPPSMLGLQQLVQRSSARKDLDQLFRLATSLSQSAVTPHVLTIVADQPGNGYKTSISSGSSELRESAPIKPTGRVMGQQGLLTIDGVDRSVLANPMFFLNRRALGAVPPVDLPATVSVGASIVSPGERMAIVSTQEQTDEQVKSSWVFKEIVSLALERASVDEVGSFSEITFVDPTVSFGRRYAYYAVALDKKMRESVRSRVVSVSVVPPLMAEAVTGSFVTSPSGPRFALISRGAERFEVYRRGTAARETARVLARPGTLVSDRKTEELSNGFTLIAEVPSMRNGEATFVDTNVKSDVDLTYRFYAVDGFSNKVQDPYEAKLRVANRSSVVSLVPPSIDVDFTEDGRALKIDVSCNDGRVIGFRVTRRDVSLFESAFHSPNEPERCVIGQRGIKRRNSSIGPRTIAPDAWNGYMRNVPGEIASFVDRTVSIDRTYQYLVEGVDHGGNLAGPSVSVPIGLLSRKVSSPPTKLTASISDGVSLSWKMETVDVSPEEMLGSVSKLQDSSVRVVFQVERRDVDGREWTPMPTTSELSFIDANVTLGKTYVYRVSSMREGGTASPYSDQLVVEFKKPVLPVARLTAVSTPTALRPVDVTVSWEYSGDVVGSWEIERADVNMFSAGNVKSFAEASSLAFKPRGIVSRESSRGTAASRDSGSPSRSFIDRNVSIENGFYYRVRAVSTSGERSEWSIVGITFGDKRFKDKLSSIVTKQQAADLSKRLVPIKTRIR